MINIYLLTSNALLPEDPSPTSDDWESRSYQEKYGAVGIIPFTAAVEAVHVAVYSNNAGSALAMAEVVIIGKFYQSSLYSATCPFSCFSKLPLQAILL